MDESQTILVVESWLIRPVCNAGLTVVVAPRDALGPHAVDDHEHSTRSSTSGTK